MKKVTFYIGCNVGGLPTHKANEIGYFASQILKGTRFENYTATSGKGFSPWGCEDVAVLQSVTDGKGDLVNDLRFAQSKLESYFSQEKVGVTVETVEFSDFG